MRRASWPAMGWIVLLLVVSCDDDPEGQGRGPEGTIPPGGFRGPEGGELPPAFVEYDASAELRARVGPPPPAPDFGPGFTDVTGVASVAPFNLPYEPQRMDPEPTAGLFADLDGDGHLEVVMSPTQLGAPAGRRSAHVYRYDRAMGALSSVGTFRAAGAGPDDELQPMGALDLDGDGFVDWIYNRASAEVSWGRAGAEVAAPVPFDPAVRIIGPAYASMAVDDVDEDGWLDLIVGTGYCCTTCRELHVFLRTAPRRFRERLDLLPATDQGTATAVLSMRFGGERVIATMGNPCGTSAKRSFFRRDALDPAGYPRFVPFDPIPPDAFIRQSAIVPEERNSDLSLWAPMGIAAQDLDHDGLLDVGISLNVFPGVFQRREPSWPLVDHTAQFGINISRSDLGKPMIPWGIALVDLDLDGRSDLVAADGNDHGAWTDPRHFVGPQRVVAHWNGGGMRFAEVAAALHLDRRGQWMSLAVDDLDEDGDVDLLVGGLGEMPRLYRNDIARGYHGLTLTLRGTTSNPLGNGARVELTTAAGERRTYFANGTGSPFVLSAPRLYVGLGAEAVAAQLRITWPSGTVQALQNVPAGALTVTEPPSLTVLSETRHAPADGRSTVRVRVTPRAPDGSVRRDAQVALAVAHGAGVVSGGAWEGEAWEAVVTAPAAPGSAVLEVRVDGVPLGVRPRIWWD